MKRKLLFIVVLMALSIGAHAKKYKVAVAMPKAQQTQFERTADWALQTIAAGQAGASDPVELELVWYDEDVMAKKDYQAIANDNERNENHVISRFAYQIGYRASTRQSDIGNG